MKSLLILFITSLMIPGRGLAQRNKSVFLEVCGNGVGFSVNYDARFTKLEKGLGFRAGIGVVPGMRLGGNDDPVGFSWPTILSIPVGLNYLLGKAPNYFEGGIGVTYLYGKGNFSFFFLEGEATLSTFMFIPSAGYRFAYAGKSFQGRVFISPYIGSNDISLFAGLSAGFKL